MRGDGSVICESKVMFQIAAIILLSSLSSSAICRYRHVGLISQHEILHSPSLITVFYARFCQLLMGITWYIIYIIFQHNIIPRRSRQFKCLSYKVDS